jgi:hypothetical protein
LEFNKLAKIVEVKRFKILKNVKTWLISMLESLKRIMLKYATLIVKMLQHNLLIVQVRLNLDLLCDIHFTRLILFVVIVESSSCFDENCSRDVFICDFVAL